MKLLILTQYFPPEIGAPQNRLHDLAVRLKESGVEVTVLTAMPNYPQMEIYSGYAGKDYLSETISGLPVHRTRIHVSQKRSVTARLLNYFSFVYSSMRYSGKLDKQYDFLLCESPPLFLGVSALYICKRKGARLIFNVSDLWPESAEKLGVVKNRLMLRLAYRLEAGLYRSSVLVTGQTQGICSDIRSRFPQAQVYWLPNGVDLQYYDSSNTSDLVWRKKNGFAADDFILLYAGIIGIAQGLEVILQAADELRDISRIKFVLLGSGPEKERLLSLREKMRLPNVFFMEAVAKKEMPHVLASVSAAVIPLRKLELFMGAIPSKIFESLAMKLPLLLGVDGEARDLFIEQGSCGVYFEPENGASLAGAIMKLHSDPLLCRQLGENGRDFVSKNFDRRKIAEEFYQYLLGLECHLTKK